MTTSPPPRRPTPASAGRSQQTRRTLLRGRFGLRRHRPTLIITGALLLLWWWVILGPTTLALLAIGTGAALTIWLVRHRRALAASIAVAAAATLLPGALVLLTVDTAAPAAPATAAVLTGHLLAGPVPALLAWTRRLPATHRLHDTVVGSLILTVSMAPVAVIGDHGFGTAALLTGLLGAATYTWTRRRRALQTSLADLPTHQGWTDLGPRILPDGSVVDQILVGHGRALLATTGRPTPAALQRAVRQAQHLAEHLHEPTTGLQPVLTDPHTTTLTWHPVQTADCTAAVPALRTGQLQQLAEQLPARTHRTPRTLLVHLAALPAPHPTGATL